MTNKERYEEFTHKIYTPIYSQPWWMDILCLPENWDVWLYEQNGEIVAAMPYYLITRNGYRVITKPPLTQNNGILFRYQKGLSDLGRRVFEERVIDAACAFIQSLDLGVYEQQYHYDFKCFLPFFWNFYSQTVRYTYVIDKDISKEEAWNNVTSNYKKKIRKGQKSGTFTENISKEEFFEEHEKIFAKQGLQCPFSYDLWDRLYEGAVARGQGKVSGYRNEEGKLMCMLFHVWDDHSVYQLLGGGVPEFFKYETYDALVWDGICYSRDRGLNYDFEGSVIKRISKSMREFGGIPMQYYRIRKVFHPEIARKECEEYCKSLAPAKAKDEA